MFKKFYICCIYSLITFCGIWLFLWLQCPQYLLYHEQNQLFLFTRSYFAHTVAVPGGMADYISEFIVQFDYIPLYGALLTALILTLSQMFLGMSCSHSCMAEAAFAFAVLPPVLYVGAMADENTLLSYAVAMMLTTLSLYILTLIKKGSPLNDTLTLIIGFCILYWLAGPFAIVFVIAGAILRRHPIAIAVGLPAAFLFVWAIHSALFEQYPLSRMLQGINYYRIPEVYPPILFIIAAATAFVPLITLLKIKITNIANYVCVIAVIAVGVVYISSSYEKEKSRLLSYDSLVRQGRWDDIIVKAGKEKPTDSFSLQALNLALGMTGQLPESMFHYDQNGMEGLIGKDRLDNTTQLITAEALFRLGLTNIAFSTTFDLQEAIMNDRKSGRLMKRMAECMLINGNYEVAAKYISFLRNTLFYSEWARSAETLLGNDAAVEAHPVYGPMRRNAFRKEAFYDYSQLDKILAMLLLDSNGTNTLAWQYFCAATMLNGDLATLIGIYNSSSELFAHQPIPRHVQEAIAMYWTFSHPTFEGLPFPVSNEVKQLTANLAQVVMNNKNNPAAWQKAAPGTYGLYFLNNSYGNQKTVNAPSYQHTHE